MLQPILNKLRPKMEEVISKLKEDLQTVRTGKASVSLVDNVIVSYYGAQTPLKQMAQIATPDANLITVQPWDTNSLGDIENALRNSNLGFGVVSDGRLVRLNLPPMTEERRNEFIKLIHQKAEACRIALRNLREESWREIQREEKNSELTEDDRYQGEKDLNKMIEDANKKILELIESKERDLKTI